MKFITLDQSSQLRLLAYILLLVDFSCRQIVSDKVLFSSPVVFQKQSQQCIEPTGYWARVSSCIYLGRYKFADSLLIPFSRNELPQLWDTTQYSSIGMGMYSDSLTNSYFSKRFDGLEVTPDYESSINFQAEDPLKRNEENHCNKYYPVYIVNQTPTTKWVEGYDDHFLFCYQEAINSSGQWITIERSFFILDTRWSVRIPSREFVAFILRKYEGEFKTKIRVRFHNGDNILYSNPFVGYLNHDQFYMTDQ